MTTSAPHDHSPHDHSPHDHAHGHAEGLPGGLGPGDGNWDERYSASEQIWSGQPNGALVTGVSHLPAGRVLDVGCGEGADAVWLARAGWAVTALDVSGVALARAAKHATDVGVSVEWVHDGLIEAELAAGSFDLVSAQYPVLARTPGNDAEHVLRDLVAPGGTLLVVHHARADMAHAKEQGFDPADHVFPADVASVLGDDWEVEQDTTRPREVPLSGGGTHHTHDVVLQARRLR